MTREQKKAHVLKFIDTNDWANESLIYFMFNCEVIDDSAEYRCPLNLGIVWENNRIVEKKARKPSIIISFEIRW